MSHFFVKKVAVLGAGVMCARAVVRDLYAPTEGARIMSKGLSGLGVLACLMGGGIGLVLGVALCGGPFLACMQLVMQRSRELAPHSTQRNAGLLTACFAVGQLSGPLLAALSSHFSGGLQPALLIAGVGLLLAGALAMQAKATGPAPCANAPWGRHHW